MVVSHATWISFQGTKKKKDEKEGETARAAVQSMDRNENGFPLFPFPSTFLSVSLFIFFFFSIFFPFLSFPVSCHRDFDAFEARSISGYFCMYI